MKDIKLTGKRCLCSGCGHYFSTESNFNRHRIGKFGVDRRCATVAEMVRLGLVMPDGIWKGRPRVGEQCQPH